MNKQQKANEKLVVICDYVNKSGLTAVLCDDKVSVSAGDVPICTLYIIGNDKDVLAFEFSDRKFGMPLCSPAVFSTLDALAKPLSETFLSDLF